VLGRDAIRHQHGGQHRPAFRRLSFSVAVGPRGPWPDLHRFGALPGEHGTLSSGNRQSQGSGRSRPFPRYPPVEYMGAAKGQAAPQIITSPADLPQIMPLWLIVSSARNIGTPQFTRQL
jgi:hypothetical protein